MCQTAQTAKWSTGHVSSFNALLLMLHAGGPGTSDLQRGENRTSSLDLYSSGHLDKDWMDVQEQLPGERLFSNTARLRFVKLHLKEPQDFRNNVLLTDGTKSMDVYPERSEHVWRQPNIISAQISPPGCQHGGGGLTIWAPVDYELLCRPKNTRVKRWAICPTKLGPAEQRSTTQQLIYTRMAEK